MHYPTLVIPAIFVAFLSCKKTEAPKIVTAPVLTQPKSSGNQDFKQNLVTEMDPGVLCMWHDRRNHYWVGTNNGLYRYDGQSCIRFTTRDGLSDNQILNIQEDTSGHIWLSTGKYGVHCFDGNTFRSFREERQTSFRDITVKDWNISPTDLWFYAGGGVFQQTGSTFRYLPIPKSDYDAKYAPNPPYQMSAYGVYTTLKDSKGSLWLGTQAMGVCKYDGKKFTWFTEHGLKGPAVLDLFEDSRGYVWFGTNGGGVFYFDGNRLHNFTQERGLANPEFIKNGKSDPGSLARVWSINEDLSGHIWLGTGDAGVWRFDGKELQQYTTRDGLPNKGVEVIYRDSNSELWFGTNGAGVYRFDGARFSQYQFYHQR